MLAVSFIAAGCGGGGDSSSASVTKAEFIKKADAVCKKGEKEIQEDFADFAKSHKDLKKPTEDDYAELIDVVLVDNVEREVEDIRALGAPAGDEDQVEAMLEAREESLKTAQDDPKSAVTGSQDVFGEASKLAKEYGLKDCGNR